MLLVHRRWWRLCHTLSLSLYFTTLALLSLSVFIYSGPYMARAGDYAYRCVISVVTGISRSSRPLPSRCLWATERNKYVYLPLHPQPIWCRTYLSFVFCVVLKLYWYHWYLLLTTKFLFKSLSPNWYKIINFYLLKNVLTITRKNYMHYISWFCDIFQVWHLMALN